MKRHEGKIAIVTGAARGIGFAIAETLARGGARTILVDRAAAVQESKDRLAKAGHMVEAITTDLADPDAIQSLVDGVLSAHKRIDILIKNAGIAPKQPNGLKTTIDVMSLEEWQQVMNVNLTSVFLLCRAVIPTMRASQWGRIINLTSVAGRAKSEIAAAHYCASKAGIIGFSRVLANETGAHGIRVNCIAPGRIMTPLAAIAGDAINKEYIKLIPAGRLGTPDDIARVASFLASDDVDFVTGTVIDVNGGSFMV